MSHSAGYYQLNGTFIQGRGWWPGAGSLLVGAAWPELDPGRDGDEDKGDDGGHGDRSPLTSGCFAGQGLASEVPAAGEPRRRDRLVLAVGGDQQPGGEVEGRADAGAQGE